MTNSTNIVSGFKYSAALLNCLTPHLYTRQPLKEKPNETHPFYIVGLDDALLQGHEVWAVFSLRCFVDDRPTVVKFSVKFSVENRCIEFSHIDPAIYKHAGGKQTMGYYKAKLLDELCEFLQNKVRPDILDFFHARSSNSALRQKDVLEKHFSGKRKRRNLGVFGGVRYEIRVVNRDPKHPIISICGRKENRFWEVATVKLFVKSGSQNPKVKMHVDIGNNTEFNKVYNDVVNLLVKQYFEVSELTIDGPAYLLKKENEMTETKKIEFGHLNHAGVKFPMTMEIKTSDGDQKENIEKGEIYLNSESGEKLLLATSVLKYMKFLGQTQISAVFETKYEGMYFHEHYTNSLKVHGFAVEACTNTAEGAQPQLKIVEWMNIQVMLAEAKEFSEQSTLGSGIPRQHVSWGSAVPKAWNSTLGLEETPVSLEKSSDNSSLEKFAASTLSAEISALERRVIALREEQEMALRELELKRYMSKKFG